MVPGPRSIFRGVEKLPPAHVLAVGPDDLERHAAALLAAAVRAGRTDDPPQWREQISAKLTESSTIEEYETSLEELKSANEGWFCKRRAPMDQ